MLPRALLFGCALIAGLAGCSNGSVKAAAADAKISEFGRYEGYSSERFSTWIRESHYVTMRDGVKLAVDIVRPATNGVATTERLPVVWTHSRYQRGPIGPAPKPDSAAPNAAPAEKPKLRSLVDVFTPLQLLLKHGYVFVSVGVRGSDVSYGRYEGTYSPAETRDAYDVMDWIVKQPWCDGNLGMFGASYLGTTQYMAASTKHPALKAIFPTVASFDLYDLIRPGGIYRENLVRHWDGLTHILDVNYVAPPVDEDADGRLAKAALAEHSLNWNPLAGFRNALTRDAGASDSGFSFTQFSPSTFLDRIHESGVAAYHATGWFDVGARDGPIWFANWKAPSRLMMGPWPHVPMGAARAERDRLEGVEELRWFDRWLKQIQNGVDTEPPVRYVVIADPDSVLDPKTWVWKTAATWPPAGIVAETFNFAAGKSGSVASVNDGLLITEPAAEGKDSYRVDLTTTTGKATRWDNTVGQGAMHYPDLAPNDAKGLTYTTPPLQRALTVVGSPVVTLYVGSNQPDGDFYALLEEVDPDGRSHYVTEGLLRASNRAEAEPSWKDLGVPWHRGFRADRAPLLPGAPAALRFELYPTATVFNAGHRLRVTITGADADNTEAPPVRGRPTVELYRGGKNGSNVVLPVMH